MSEEEPRPVSRPDWQLEFETERKVKAALAQDAANQAVRRSRPVAPVEQTDEAAEERRRFALQQAYMARGAEFLGPDRGGEAMLLPNGQLMAVTRKHGLIAEMRPGAFESEVVGPAEWEEHDRAWRARQRTADNLVLAEYWGRRACLEAGLFTEAEAAELPPERPPGPGAAPYRLERSVAG